MGKRLGIGGSSARIALTLGLLLLGSLARADVGSDWLAKAPPPPRNLDEAMAQCGGGTASYDVNKDPWRHFAPQLQAAIDQANKDQQTKMGAGDPQAQQDMAAQMMAQMSDPSAMQAYMQSAQTYNQYIQDLNQHGPNQQADALFGPALGSGKSKVSALLSARAAALDKCPQEVGEGGQAPTAACAKPIYADTERKQVDAANAYLAAIGKSWPQYQAGMQDFLGKLAALPPGVDANNPQIKIQLQGVPSAQLESVKQAADVTHRICESSVSLKNQSSPGG